MTSSQVPPSQGSVIGGILLVSGSCIGAGMLALPILTGLSGFFPSLSVFLFSWALMTFTGLLLVEASGWSRSQTNLISIVQDSLGNTGRWVCWVSYLFLFYSLLVAYVAASGTIFSAMIGEWLHIEVSQCMASLFFTVLFGIVIYFGTRPSDFLNRPLMVGLIATYVGMIAFGVTHMKPVLLLRFAPQFILSSVPVLVVSFGFQNMVPSMTAYLKGDFLKVRWVILGGSLFTLVVYLIWSLLVLGIVPFGGPHGLLATYEKGEEATKALYAILGSNALTAFARGFAFFAIVTSFLAQGLALTHFLADGFKLPPNKTSGRLLCIAALLPPLVFAFLDPSIFYKALNFAGGICAMVLFGILPPLITWRGRYLKKHRGSYRVLGGKTSLVLTLGSALFVIGCELKRIFGF